MPSSAVISPTASGPSSRQPRICTRLGADKANMASAIWLAASSAIRLWPAVPTGGIDIVCTIHMNDITCELSALLRGPTRGGEPVTAEPHRTRHLPAYRDA